jgi:hypothetical protein
MELELEAQAFGVLGQFKRGKKRPLEGDEVCSRESVCALTNNCKTKNCALTYSLSMWTQSDWLQTEKHSCLTCDTTYPRLAILAQSSLTIYWFCSYKFTLLAKTYL